MRSVQRSSKRAVKAVKEVGWWLDALGRHCCAGRSYRGFDAVVRPAETPDDVAPSASGRTQPDSCTEASATPSTRS